LLIRVPISGSSVCSVVWDKQAAREPVGLALLDTVPVAPAGDAQRRLGFVLEHDVAQLVTEAVYLPRRGVRWVRDDHTFEAVCVNRDRRKRRASTAEKMLHILAR